MSQLAENAVQVDDERKRDRTACSSNYSWKKLSPGSQLKRRSNLVQEKQAHIRQATKVFEHTGKLNNYMVS